jgi:hypothetical protein
MPGWVDHHPGKSMTEDDGRLFVPRIVNRWLDSLE